MKMFDSEMKTFSQSVATPLKDALNDAKIELTTPLFNMVLEELGKFKSLKLNETEVQTQCYYVKFGRNKVKRYNRIIFFNFYAQLVHLCFILTIGEIDNLDAQQIYSIEKLSFQVNANFNENYIVNLDHKALLYHNRIYSQKFDYEHIKKETFEDIITIIKDTNSWYFNLCLKWGIKDLKLFYDPAMEFAPDTAKNFFRLTPYLGAIEFSAEDGSKSPHFEKIKDEIA
jgi:hypothetical protein